MSNYGAEAALPNTQAALPSTTSAHVYIYDI